MYARHAAVFIDAGPRYEVKYTSGISHFLQKLAFNVCKYEYVEHYRYCCYE